MDFRLLTISEIEELLNQKVGRPRKHPKQDEKVLKLDQISKGDIVRSVGGNGPYYQGAKSKTYKGTYGLLKVDEVLSNGFYAYKVSKRQFKINNTARYFVYMGKSEKVDIINREPHKIVKV